MAGEKILIVEDEDLMRSILEKLLKKEEYVVSTAADGADGLEIFRREHPDLILTDVQMPNMTGLELLDEVRKQDRDTLVIVLTAFGSLESAVEAMRKGAHDYITKPFINDDIRMTVSRGLELKRTREELKETQELVVQSEKMAALGKLAAGIVHEINTPIGSIQSNIQLLDRLLERLKIPSATDHPPGERKWGESSLRFIETAEGLNRTNREACKRIIGLAESLRSLAHLDQGKLKQADLHEAIDSVLNLLQHELGDRVAVIKIFGKIPKIVCYPGELHQMFLHLLLNAIQAIDGPGEIGVRTFQVDEAVTAEISDTGRGIPDDMIDRVFDPGFTTRGDRVRLGMGLGICSRIAQEHGGTIKINSQPGEGSKVTVILPVDGPLKRGNEK